MGGIFGGKDSETKVDTTPWAPMQPHILGAASTIRNTVDANQGNLNQIAGGIRSQLPQLALKAFGAQPGLAAAQGYATDVLGGKYLGQGNPYLNSMIQQTQQNVGNQVNSTFSGAGRTGGGNHTERLGQGLANAENALRYQDYSSERDRMSQAGALLPGLTAAQYAGISPYLQAAQTAGNLPYAGIGALSPLLGQGASAGSSTQNAPSDVLGSVMGGIGMALPFILSDERAKDNIELVGKLENGLGLYEWDYKAGVGIEGRWRGVMAQEVAKSMPWMLGPEVNGYMTVRYMPERVG